MDNFREWLSDNLRYIMLIGGILILLLLIFFGIRAVSGIINSDEGTREEQMNDDSKEPDANNSTETPSPTETPADPLEKNAYPQVNTLIHSYYNALGNRDVETLKTLVDDFDPSEEAKIENSQYIEGYSDVEIYTKKGMADNTYVVFAKYNYICTGVQTPVPALSQLYVVGDGEEYRISQNADSDAEIQDYVSQMLQDQEVRELISDTEAAYERAQETDPDLKEFLENLGRESSQEDGSADAEGETDSAAENVTANDAANIRSAPGGDSEIIGVLDPGEQIEKTGEDGLWVQVNYEGQTGYIFHEYVE